MLSTRHPLRADLWERALANDRELRTRVPSLRKPVLGDWQDNHRLVVDQGVPWIFGPLEIDPLLSRRGGMPLPDEIAAELRALSDAGATFERILVAHEVDPSGPVARLADDVPPWGVALSSADARRCVTRPSPSQRSREGADTLDGRVRRAGRVGRRIAETAAVVAAAPLAVLDPIVFGVNGIVGPPRHDEPAVFYPLAAWRW